MIRVANNLAYVHPDGLAATPATDDITITVQTSLFMLEPVWRRFERIAAGHVFQSFDWVSIWHNTIGLRDGIAPHIVIGQTADGRILFLLPFGIREQYGLKVLSWLGGREAALKGGLFDYDILNHANDEDWAFFWRRIWGLIPRVDLIELSDQPERFGEERNPFAFLQTHHQREAARRALLRGPSGRRFETFGAADGPENRGAPKLESLGKVAFEVAATPVGITTLLQQLFADKAKQLLSTGQADPFADETLRAYYWRHVQRMYPHGKAHLSALTLNGVPVAIAWGLIFNRRFYCLLSVHDPKLQSASARLLNELTRWCLAEGLDWVEFGAGDHGLRMEHGEQVALFSTIKGFTFKGRIAASILSLHERLKRGTEATKR
jgi:CelD/BcsL family acetyltransferase involved in cellulose biosynthesis